MSSSVMPLETFASRCASLCALKLTKTRGFGFRPPQSTKAVVHPVFCFSGSDHSNRERYRDFARAGRTLSSPVVTWRQAGFSTEHLSEMARAGIADGHADFDNAGIRLLQKQPGLFHALANEVARR